jgi:hypothetical protein
MEDEIIEQELQKHRQINDRFTFDNLFRYCLRLGLAHEECKEVILSNCSLSTLVFQERIENKYYLEIPEQDKLSIALVELRNDIFSKLSPTYTYN